MSRPRRLRWTPFPPRPIPKHPYRDTTIMYAVFAVVLVLIAWAAGTSVGRAAVVASVVFIAASAWSAFGWHRRIREQRPFEDVDL